MNPTDQQIIETMEQRGGNFVRRLADLWLAGDEVHRATISATFRLYFMKYREIAIHEMEVAAREEAAK